MLTYVESEGCQDGRDGRERGVDEHAPLVLSIHIHDFFYYVLVVEKMLSYSLCCLGGCDLFLDVEDALSRSEYPYGRKLLAIRFLAGQDSQHRGTEDEHLGDEDEYRS